MGDRFAMVRVFYYAVLSSWLLPIAAVADDFSIRNQTLEFKVDRQDGSYSLQLVGAHQPILRSNGAAQIASRLGRSWEYPPHEGSQSGFSDQFGHGPQFTG